MNFIPALLFAFSINIDSFIISLSYGIKQVAISMPQNLFLSMITTLGTICALLLGQQISLYFSPETLQLFGNLFLIILGFYYLFKPIIIRILSHLFSSCKCFSFFHLPSSRNISILSFKTCFILGLSLSLNNLGIGISASITGISPTPAIIFTLLSSILFLFFGNILGKHYIRNVNEMLADALCGVILILLGSIDYLSHIL